MKIIAAIAWHLAVWIGIAGVIVLAGAACRVVALLFGIGWGFVA